MFQDDYKKAYDQIKPDPDSMEQILANAGNVRQKSIIRRWKRTVAAVVCCICIWNVLPVCAANIPAFYKILESVSPGIADLFVPVEKSCSSQGVIMRVEAVNLDGSQAEIIVSFQDEEGYDRIHGTVDIFDSYGLKSYQNASWLGGCSFLRYDEAEDKAYFMISVEADKAFDKSKLTFYSYRLLCGITNEERDIGLSGAERNAETKSVTVSGWGGIGDISKYSEVLLGEKETDDPRDAYRVLAAKGGELPATDDFTITGIAYQDDILRVQICMGDNSAADRHVQPFLVDGGGEERHEDYSVSWYEEIDGAECQFYEFWFLGPFENLEQYRMYGIFHNSGELIEGDWKVTFRLE